MAYRGKDFQSYAARAQGTTYDQNLRAYMLNIYNYMASALALTGLVAYLGANWAPLASLLYRFEGGHIGLTGFGMLAMFAPLAFILALSFGINRMSPQAAQMTFWAYAATVGLSLSSIFFVYSGVSIARAFFITAATFGGMSLWGYSTRRDLRGMGHFMMMGLFGVIIAMFVNVFLHSTGLQFVISTMGVIVFTGLTAYDTQKIRDMYYAQGNRGEMAAKLAIMGALSLYLDFINLFMYALQFFGDRRSN
jgi:FtsH-binding integral membrane protein